MNRNSIIGMILVGLLFVGFTWYNSKQQEKYRQELEAYNASVAQTEQAHSGVAAATGSDGTSEPAGVSSAEGDASGAGGAGSAAAPLEIEEFTVENGVLRVDFSTLGGQVTGVTLKDYTRYAKGERTENVQLFEKGSAKFDIVNIHTADKVFRLVENGVEGGEHGAHRVVMECDGITYEYLIYNSGMPERDYLVDFNVRLAAAQPLDIAWNNRSYQNEKGFRNENTYTTVSWHEPGEQTIESLGVSDKDKSKSVEGVANWVAFKQQFFSSVLLSGVADQLENVNVAFHTVGENSGFVKDFSATMTLRSADTHDMAFYFGPNKYAILRDVELTDSKDGQPDLRLERLVPLGWGIFGWVNRYIVIPTFDWLQNWGLGFGLIILILSFLVKFITLPLTYRSYISTAKMRIIRPEVDVINKRYPKQEDAMKRQQATMELYKKAGINPMGGCIPMLIQMPIIIAMFRFFPASIELRGQRFLWADDLSAYDSVLDFPFKIPFYGDHVSLFALLMAVALFFFSKVNYQQTASTQPQMAGMKFMMLYLMPVMMLLWFNGYSSGLTYYYFLANLLTIVQTFVIRKFVNDEKLHAVMRATSVRNTKKATSGTKSKFQQRYEEAIRMQQERRRQ